MLGEAVITAVPDHLAGFVLVAKQSWLSTQWAQIGGAAAVRHCESSFVVVSS